MALKPVDYDERQHAVYAKARAMAPDTLARWMDVFAGFLPPARPLAILDLGSGTGRFTPALAKRFGGPVYGVEPSGNMRRVAEAQPHADSVQYLPGHAAAVPLPDGTVDAVLLFLSFHHFPDHAAAVREIARVLRPGGRVLLRGVFSDRPPGEWWGAFFPRLAEIEAQVFPTLAQVTDVFAAVGLAAQGFMEVEERYAYSQAEALERLKLKGISTFEHLTDAELAQGFAHLDAAAAAGTLHIPMTGRSDLLVLG